jgi:hypothetical protein
MRRNTDAQVSGGVAGGSEEGPVLGLERSRDVVLTGPEGQPGNGEEPMSTVKPFGIAKRVVWEAYRQVKANRGAAGIDGQSLEMFEANLKGNLYRIWNRMSSGSYFPRRKYKKLLRHEGRSYQWIWRIARRQPGLFIHWRAYGRAAGRTMGAV